MKPIKIKSMTATFGKLEKARLEPGPGLTLIHAPNEGGKSTWAAFWRAMLYGIDTRDRDKKGYLADKNHYQPWSGTPMEGEITLEYGSRDITIRRGPRGNTPFGFFSAVYTKTQAPVPGLTASNCGELLTGAGQEVFTRSAFLGDSGLSLTSAPELERRIAALVTSGGEEVSFSQAMNRLKDWKNRRQVNRSVGEIPKLEGELYQVREALEQLEEVTLQISQLEGEQAALEKKRDTLSHQAQAHRLLAQKELADRYTRVSEAYQTAQTQLETLEREQSEHPIPDREALKKAQGDLQYIKALEEEIKQGETALKEAEEAAAKAKEAAEDERFPDMTGEEAVTRAEAAGTTYRAAVERGARKNRRAWLLQIAGVLGGGTLIAVQFIQRGQLGLLSGLGLGFYALMTLLTIVALKASKKLRTQADESLSAYHVPTPEELTAKAQDYRERWQAAEKAAQEAEVVQNALTEWKGKRDTAKSELLDFVHAFAPEVRDLFGCSAALSRALNLDHELAMARDRTEERRRRLEDLEAQDRGARGPGASPSGPGTRGYRPGAGPRRGPVGGGRRPTESGCGHPAGHGGSRRPVRPAGGAGNHPGAPPDGGGGPFPGYGGPDPGQRPASGALLPGAEPAGRRVYGPAHRKQIPGGFPHPGSGGLCPGGGRGAAPGGAVAVPGDGGPALSGRPAGGVPALPAVPAPHHAGRRPGLL